MSDSVQLPEDDYRQLEAFIARTPKGRAFLEQHARRARTMGIDAVEALVERLRDAWLRHEQAASAVQRDEALRHELQDMSATISQARREIASIQPKEGGSDRIATAANELDAIVISTERASIEILGAAERMMETTGALRAAGAPAVLCDALDMEVTNIFTACSFQDLTGQRTTKVVNALRYIEQRIMAVMNLWGMPIDGAGAPVPEEADKRPDAHLLNGPSSDGVDQDEIDRLLNSPATAPEPAMAASGVGKETAPEAPPTPLDQSSIDALFG